MERRKLSPIEAYKSLQDSLQSEFDVAQILIEDPKYEEFKRHKNYLPGE